MPNGNTNKLVWWIMGIIATLFTVGIMAWANNVTSKLNKIQDDTAELKSQLTGVNEKIISDSRRIDSVEKDVEKLSDKVYK